MKNNDKKINLEYYKTIGDYLTDQIVKSTSLINNKINPNLYEFYVKNLKNEFSDVDTEILEEMVYNFKYLKRNDWHTQKRIFKQFKNMYTRLKTILEIQKYLHTHDGASVTDIVVYLDSYEKCRKNCDGKLEFKSRLYKSSQFIYKYRYITKENLQCYMDVLHLFFHNIVDWKKNDDDFKDVIVYYDELVAELDVFIPSLIRKEIKEIKPIVRKERSDKGKHTKSEYKKILYSYFDSNWKNRDIQKETDINYNTINKWRTIYNKEKRKKMNVENKSIEEVIKMKNLELFDIYLDKDEFFFIRSIKDDVMNCFVDYCGYNLDKFLMAKDRLSKLFKIKL